MNRQSSVAVYSMQSYPDQTQHNFHTQEPNVSVYMPQQYSASIIKQEPFPEEHGYNTNNNSSSMQSSPERSPVSCSTASASPENFAQNFQASSNKLDLANYSWSHPPVPAQAFKEPDSESETSFEELLANVTTLCEMSTAKDSVAYPTTNHQNFDSQNYQQVRNTYCQQNMPISYAQQFPNQNTAAICPTYSLGESTTTPLLSFVHCGRENPSYYQTMDGDDCRDKWGSYSSPHASETSETFSQSGNESDDKCDDNLPPLQSDFLTDQELIAMSVRELNRRLRGLR